MGQGSVGLCIFSVSYLHLDLESDLDSDLVVVFWGTHDIKAPVQCILSSRVQVTRMLHTTRRCSHSGLPFGTTVDPGACEVWFSSLPYVQVCIVWVQISASFPVFSEFM